MSYVTNVMIQFDGVDGDEGYDPEGDPKPGCDWVQLKSSCFCHKGEKVDPLDVPLVP